jgi:acyl-CoA thioester hydrolase
MAREERLSREAFRRFERIDTRWHDNDVFGHVNNVVYYAFFDTAVNRFLVERGLLDVKASGIVGLVAETRCAYFESVAFPDRIEVGVAVERMGTSSVTYRLAVFRDGAGMAAAQGRFTHVYVDRATQRPVPVPEAIREALAPFAAPIPPPA